MSIGGGKSELPPANICEVVAGSKVVGNSHRPPTSAKLWLDRGANRDVPMRKCRGIPAFCGVSPDGNIGEMKRQNPYPGARPYSDKKSEGAAYIPPFIGGCDFASDCGTR